MRSNQIAQLVGVNVYHGQLQAVKDVSLDIFENEVVTIIGSNGAGKTTLLQAMSGMIPTRSGEIYFLGKSMVGMSPEKVVRLGLSQVPERRRLFPTLSVMDNLLLGTYSLSAKERRETLGETLASVFKLFPILKERLKVQAASLSGGQQQMLAVARGLMSRPKLLLLDEPSLGLAPMLVKETMEAIAYLASQGTAILLVEQNARAALKIANRAYLMERGNIVLSGTAEEVSQSELVYSAYLGK